MTIREEIARLTPMARRYARALAAAEPEERVEVSDQMVQEAVLRILRGDWSGRHSSVRVSLYVTITALNRARLRGRASARNSGGEDALAGTRAAPSGKGRAGVTQALDALGNEEREALLLIAVEEFDYAQACEILNIPRPTLIARLSRARRSIAERMDPQHALEPRVRRASSPHLRVVK